MARIYLPGTWSSLKESKVVGLVDGAGDDAASQERKTVS